MAANMQHMGGVGQMMPQQMRKPANAGRLQQFVYQNLLQQAQAPNALAWQANITINDRMSKTMDLISNISLAGNGIDPMRAAEFGCNCEREIYVKSPNKEAYDQAMSNKILEYFKKRQANEPNLQNTLNAQAQAAQAAQAQAMNMQAQMGHGLAQLPQQAFQHLQHPMQASHIPQHAQQQPQTHQQPMGMGMGMCVGLQVARGAMPPGLGAQQAMGMATGLNRPPQQLANEMSRLAQADKAKVMELATKMMAQANEQLKSTARAYVRQRLPPQQLADFQSQGKDPAIWFFQAQAFHALKTSMQNRMQQQGGVQNPNVGQAALMQQQHSQQSLPPRQNIMNPGQPNEFSHFTSNMESIKDQQNIGFRAQQAGQMVVPASNGGARNATPQPGNQNMVGQPGPNQTPRQPQQQHPQHQMQQQPQHQQGANLQQMKMNQAQTPQAHLQMKQIQGQNSISGGIPPSQSPAMNTLNTPVSRPPSGMNAMVGPGMGQQGGMQFGDQRFNQGIQRPNNQAFNNMLSSMSQDQRQALHGMPTEKLNEVMRRWQGQRQEQVAMGAGQMNQKRPPQQFGGHMNMAGPQGMQQPPGPGVGNQQQQMQMPRIPMQTAQAQALMDQMDLPPQVHSQLGQLPGEVKKWRDLKMWLSQNNNSLPPAIRSQLFALQQKQFQILMHRRVTMSGQNQGGMPGQMPNQQLGMQRPAGNVPPHILQVTPQEIMQVRSQSANFAGLSDDKMQTMILQMKKQAWFQQQQQQQQQMRAQQAQAQAQLQANPQAQGQPGGQGQMPVVAQAALPMQPTPQPHQLTPQQIRTPQPHPQGTPNTAGQSAAMQGGTPKQQPPGPQVNDQSRNRAQAHKNLKRPSTDETPDTAGPENASSAASRAASQTNQQAAKSFTSLTPQQLASLKPEQRARYEQYLKMHLSGQAQAASAEALNHLRQLSQEEQRKFSQEPMPDIPMNQQEHNDTAAKLQRISMDMQKVSRGLTKWYSITRDDARAKMFFRTRMRIMKQFCDSDSMRELKDKFSVRSSDIDQARAILESMAKDLAASMMKSGMLKQTGQAQQNQAAVQGQGAPQPPPPPPPPPQQQQQQQGQPVPLNAANLEKNSQAISKMSQQRPGAKVSQVPPAPKATAPPFPFGESSPHGNPSYMGKPKDMNLQLPPARKKQKTAGQQAGQGTQGASPSPKTSKNASPEMRRAVEPPKPVLLCKDAECASSAVGFSSEQALRQHVDEEHVKPKENPVKFVKENLALALALEPDGSLKKPRQASAAMKTSTSKQGHGTPGQVASTPLAHEASMKRTGSAGSRPLDGRVTGKTDGEATRADPWAGCTIDPQAFIANLGWEKGIGLPDIVGEANMYRSLTPKDTPGSSKDSGSSEPNSDISEGAALDIDVYWRNYENLDADLLLEFDKAKLEGDMVAKEANGQTLDPMVLMKAPFGQSSDWDDIDVDYGKAWELDTRLYSMAT